VNRPVNKKVAVENPFRLFAHAAATKRRIRNSMMAGRIFLYTSRDRNRGGVPSRGRGRNFGGPSILYAPIEHSRSTNRLARARYFRSKTQFLANFSPAARKFGAPRDPGNKSP